MELTPGELTPGQLTPGQLIPGLEAQLANQIYQDGAAPEEAQKLDPLAALAEKINIIKVVQRIPGPLDLV